MYLTMNDGCRLFVDNIGTSLRPGGKIAHPVLFVHGGPGGRHNGMKKAFQELADDYQLFFYDQRGMGRSDRSVPRSWNLHRWTYDLRQLISALGIEGCSIVAQSFGSYVAVELAANHPDSVGRMVLGGAKLTFDLEKVVAAFARLGGDNVATIAEQFWSGSKSEQVLRAYEEVCFPLYQCKHPLSNPKLDYEMQQNWLNSGLHYTFMDRLAPKVTCPVKIIAGDSDPITPAESSLDLARCMTSAPVVDFRGVIDAGHAVYLDQRELFIEEVRDFLPQP